MKKVPEKTKKKKKKKQQHMQKAFPIVALSECVCVRVYWQRKLLAASLSDKLTNEIYRGGLMFLRPKAKIDYLVL